MTITADLSGKRALVTGASGGFGSHFARVLAAAGATVILAARRVSLLEAVAADIAAGGGRAMTLALDVGNAESVRAALSAAGHIDILVNNAGITNTKAALDQTEEDWDRIIDTNLKGAWLVALETARHMKETGGGSMINIASILGLRQASHVGPYSVSKAALLQLTKQLALEFARYEIRVNALAPGYFATDLNRDYFATDAGSALIKRIPQRRLGNLSDLDGPLLLLASEASRFMTGTVIAVDGGHLLSQL